MNALRYILALLLACVALGTGVGVQPAPHTPRFAHVDVFIDAGAERLAAYQVEFVGEIEDGTVTLAGIEGSGGARGTAYSEPPAYDPAALAGGRVILADFSTAPDVPSGRSRVARLHLMIDAPADHAPAYSVTLMAAGSPEGGHIQATASVVEGDGR
jgi:hypothetical protein